MKPRQRRLAFIVTGLGLSAMACALILNAFRSNLVFFFTPTQVQAREAPQGRSFRLGGLVEPGSLERETDGLAVRFKVTDTAVSVPVVFRGMLPDLFREGKGVVTQGRLDAAGVFRADEVLAKHDENYMPPAARDAIDGARAAKREATEGRPAADPEGTRAMPVKLEASR